MKGPTLPLSYNTVPSLGLAVRLLLLGLEETDQGKQHGQRRERQHYYLTGELRLLSYMPRVSHGWTAPIVFAPGSNVLLSATVDSEVAGKVGFILNWLLSCYIHHYRVERKSKSKKSGGEKNDQVITNLLALPQSRDIGALRSGGSKSNTQAPPEQQCERPPVVLN